MRLAPLTAALVSLLLVLAAPAAGAQKVRFAADDTVPLVSGNVTPLLTLPVGKPIGARFKDDLMYVTGTEGLEIYDVKDPALPKPVGALALPHFENEDVDVGGGLLLISNDPSEGIGILYVVDVSNPAVPTVKGILSNGFIGDGGATQVATGGAIDIAKIFTEAVAPGLLDGVEPVGFPFPAGTGHTVSCVKPDCSWAYMAGTTDGITIVDLTNPEQPRIAGQFKPDVVNDLVGTHDVQIDSQGLAWIVGGDGTAAYDVTDPVHPRQVVRSDEKIRGSGQAGIPGPVSTKPYFDFELGGKGETPIDLIHHNSLRLGDMDRSVRGKPKTGTLIAPEGADGGTGCNDARGCASEGRVAGFRLKPFRRVAGKTYPAGGNSPLFGVTEEDYNRPTCEGAGEFQTWGMTAKKSNGRHQLGLLGRYQTELASLVQGRGWAPVTGLCSAHYFDYRDGIVAQGWYEEGTRFLDVRDPVNIKQVGYWVPTKGETWSVVFPPTDPTGEIVYALDFARGIDVLRLNRGDLKPRTAPVRRSWLTGSHGRADGATARTGLTDRTRYGFLCRRAI